MTQVQDNAALPTWLKVNEDGVTVTLKHKVNLNGVVVDRMTMRAPSVRDVRAAKAAGGGSPEEFEMALFCSLLTVTETELVALKYVDYMRLQAGYFRLVEEDDV